MLTYDDNQKATKAHCRLAFSVQPQRFFLPLLVGLHGSTDTTARKSVSLIISLCHFAYFTFRIIMSFRKPQTHSFKILVFIVRKGFFFCLEYRETLFSCQFCLKRKESTIFYFSYQNHGLKMPIVRLF